MHAATNFWLKKQRADGAMLGSATPQSCGSTACRAEGRSNCWLELVNQRRSTLDFSRATGDCQEFCAVGHDDEKERIITW
ncbi:hypothetical protein, partial [Sinorhizobium medicae]|uniref:hypothetical protein n=1 Tax=Sinorhizobium medicae TaxID=110321 RepID=UPI0011B426A6